MSGPGCAHGRAAVHGRANGRCPDARCGASPPDRLAAGRFEVRLAGVNSIRFVSTVMSGAGAFLCDSRRDRAAAGSTFSPFLTSSQGGAGGRGVSPGRGGKWPATGTDAVWEVRVAGAPGRGGEGRAAEWPSRSGQRFREYSACEGTSRIPDAGGTRRSGIGATPGPACGAQDSTRLMASRARRSGQPSPARASVWQSARFNTRSTPVERVAAVSGGVRRIRRRRRGAKFKRRFCRLPGRPARLRFAARR